MSLNKQLMGNILMLKILLTPLMFIFHILVRIKNWLYHFGILKPHKIDIPVISHAVIAASSRNPRQFIQRRGRVLRKHPEKNHAEVFDCLVLPKTKSSKKYNGLLTGEVKRATEFASYADNRDACLALLRNWLIELGKSPDEIMQDEEDDA